MVFPWWMDACREADDVDPSDRMPAARQMKFQSGKIHICITYVTRQELLSAESNQSILQGGK